jgi:predicted TIM-barrel fold metal-dependent hydrolase
MNAGRIDVHHHYYPPEYLKAAAHHLLADSPAGVSKPGDWSPQRSLDEMERNGVAAAVVSLVPGVWFGDGAEAVRLSRLCNEWAARLARDYPGRFGVFAALPLPDVDACLREIEYAFDVLKVDGVGLMTSVNDKYPGDERFAPVFDELNRRKAVVYFHPHCPACCRDLIPGVAGATLEFTMDTSRAITSLLFSGTLARCSDARFVFSHSGGTMPLAVQRLVRLPSLDKRLAPKVPNGVMHELQKLYYETAQGVTPMALGSLLHIVKATQLLYGSDYPFRSGSETLEGLDAYGFSTEDRRAIDRGNALRLFPRFG